MKQLDFDFGKSTAKIIADIFIQTTTEERGYLMLEIAQELHNRGQYFTSACFDMMGDKYNDA